MQEEEKTPNMYNLTEQ